MIRLNDITSQILTYIPKPNLQLIEKAYIYSAKIHHGQLRLSGEPYLSHLLETAYLLSLLEMDTVCITAGILHDALEDTEAEYDEIKSLFGEDVANIVEGVTKISKMHFTSPKHKQAENVRKMILAMSSDIRVILVKLADRTHNMRTLGFQPPDKQKKIAQETLNIYAPLAGRMGIYKIKSSLEDLCLYYLEPETYSKIKTEVELRKGQREKIIKDISEELSKKLEEMHIKAVIKGRQKNFYSIYKKMLDQNLSIDQVYDILAFRIIVTTIKECYEVLGYIHSMWKPIHGKFKDYISMPKANMYQSLHTTVISTWGDKMEMQIRTSEMDKISETGIAAHWKYKEGSFTNKTHEKQFEWLRQLVDSHKNVEDSDEFLETVRMNLFPDEVYVFTPKGEVKEFPKGATIVDFAYAIHSEVGNKCIGARVNGKMVSIRYNLRTGDIIEIITSSKQRPNNDWLKFAQTPRARTRIRQWISKEGREESINLGKSLLEKALEDESIMISNIMKSDPLNCICKDMSFHSIEDILAQIGFGKISPKSIVTRIKSKLGIKEDKPENIINKVPDRIRQKKGIVIDGVSDMLIRYAKCCRPLPGEKIIGYITRGSGITVHTRICTQIKNSEKERLVEVSWSESPKEKELFQASLKVTSLDQKGLLTETSGVITRYNVNIIKANVQTTPDKIGIMNFTLEVENYIQLQEIIGALKRIKDVLTVERL